MRLGRCARWVPVCLIAVGGTTAALATESGTAAGSSGWFACHVTKATTATRPPAPVFPSFTYGNAKIAVALNPPSGRLVAGPLPGGGMRATINPDGSIYAKVGWWRAGDGAIAIAGRRLDRRAPPLRADVPPGYGAGFQATALTFPTVGCWRVTGAWRGFRIAFVVQVSASPRGGWPVGYGKSGG